MLHGVVLLSVILRSRVMARASAARYSYSLALAVVGVGCTGDRAFRLTPFGIRANQGANVFGTRCIFFDEMRRSCRRIGSFLRVPPEALRPSGLLPVHDCPQFRQSRYRLAVDLVNDVAREQLAGWTIGRHGQPGDQDPVRAARRSRQKCFD